MKKLFLTSIIILSILTLCGCGSNRNTRDEVQQTAEPTSTVPLSENTDYISPSPTLEIVYVEPTPSPTSEILIVSTPAADQSNVSSSGAYSSIIDTYSIALSNNWDRETCINNGVNYLVSSYAQYAPHELGYYFMDIDQNGTEELIIGCNQQIIAMYTLVNSVPVQIIDAGERSSFYLEPDGVIVNYGSSSAFLSSHILYKLDGATLELLGAIIADYSANEESPWFYAEDNDWDVSNDKKVSNETALKWIAAYEDNYVYLPYIALY